MISCLLKEMEKLQLASHRKTLLTHEGLSQLLLLMLNLVIFQLVFLLGNAIYKNNVKSNVQTPQTLSGNLKYTVFGIFAVKIMSLITNQMLN